MLVKRKGTGEVGESEGVKESRSEGEKEYFQLTTVNSLENVSYLQLIWDRKMWIINAYVGKNFSVA